MPEDLTPQEHSPIKPPTQEEERIAAYQRHVYKDGELIKNRHYNEALTHFQNSAAAEAAGLSYSRGRSKFEESQPKDEDVPNVSNWVAMNSWFKENRIMPSSIAIDGKDIKDIDTKTHPELAPLQHEIALIHMEEWVHGLQKLRGKNLTDQQSSEVDVAAYMLKNNIPITPVFLRRYDRGLELDIEDFEDKDDTLDTMPALRRGSFVNVKRRDQSIESNWQVSGFDTQTGDVIVVKFNEKLKKVIPKEQLAKQNPHGTYPFNQTKNFIELFSKIDELKFIQGTQDQYQSSTLKKAINRVREGKAPIEQIPRSGGLRLKVDSLIKQ